ncbi:MAG: hypothetical protein Q8T08_20060 [Ignavibacteria bacterium]|nr:hypothetical protein [Ignavibacteria bacterium]
MNHKNRIIVILCTLLLSSCTQRTEVESCRYGVLIQSFSAKSDKEYCQAIYDSIDSSKFNRRMSDNIIFGIDSILINFELSEGENEYYFINKEGILSYNVGEFTYKSNINTDIYTQLSESIEAQKYPSK